MDTLNQWERLRFRYSFFDATRAAHERIAWNEPDKRIWAEDMIATLTEKLFNITQQMEELEAELPDTLHHAAEIVNGYALVIRW